MKYQGLNLTNLKNINRAKIVRLLNDRGNLSRKDIAAALNLTPAAVTQICSELLSEGVLVEKGEVREERRAGRRKINIGINENYGMIRIRPCRGQHPMPGSSLKTMREKAG